MLLVWSIFTLLFFISGGTNAFGVQRLSLTLYPRLEEGNLPQRCSVALRESRSDDIEIEKNKNKSRSVQNDDKDMFESIQKDPELLPDLAWRVEKMRLEEANTRRFLRSKPRYLPYEEARRWAISWNLWDSEEEWRMWIEEGEKRTSYIPSKPDEYYSRLGQWRGWGHFLGKE